MSPDHPPGLDLDRLRELLERERPGLLGGPLSGRLIEGGRSNLTYTVTDGTATWVVRRPPLGHVLATAHDMKREHRVISALHPTPVPVPRTGHPTPTHPRRTWSGRDRPFRGPSPATRCPDRDPPPGHPIQ